MIFMIHAMPATNIKKISAQLTLLLLTIASKFSYRNNNQLLSRPTKFNEIPGSCRVLRRGFYLTTRKSHVLFRYRRLSVLHSLRRTYTVLKSASFLPFFRAVESPLFSDINTGFARNISESLLLFLSSDFSTSSNWKTSNLKNPFAPQDILPSYS